MKVKYTIMVLLYFLASLVYTAVSAQNIRNDTIFVSTNALVELRFNDKKSTGKIIDGEGAYELGGTKKSLTVKALQKEAKPKKLIVDEGQRKHSFILVYVESVTESQMVVDWSNLKKLKEHVKAKEGKANEIFAKADALYNNGDLAEALPMFVRLLEEVEVGKVGLVENRIASIQDQLQKQYSDLVKKGDNFLSEKKYKEAWDAYKEAHKILPGKDEATVKAEEVSGPAYRESIKNAQEASEAKKYGDARELYETARIIDPETFAKTNQRAYETSLKLEAEIKYKQSVEAGDEAAQIRDWEKAKAHYGAALNLNAKEPGLSKKIQNVNEALQKQEDYRKKETEYYSVLSKAKLLAAKAMNMADFEAAIHEYKKASTLFPERRFPKDKIAEIQKRRRNDSARN
ncbi:hypothetical protein HRG84_23545 [Flavisolibacter sp. BT320]|nr:hypothetical protein [Flavisolibacter longurius]